MQLLNSESKDITDEDITENIKEHIEGTDIDFEPDDTETLKLNTVRKTLYKLYSEKLAQFRRIRDKSTGWFIYYWWHEFDLIEELLLEKKNLIVDIAALTEFNVLNTLKNLKTKTTVFTDSNLTINDDLQSLMAKPKLDKKYYDLRIKSSEKQLEEFADIISKELKASTEYTKKFYITISLFAGVFDTATPKLERFLK